MSRFVALLRGVNVGGRRRLAMADLRAELERLGLTDVTTYLQSGNAVFTSGNETPRVIAVRVEKALAEAVGDQVDVLVLTAEQIGEVASANPFLSREGAEKVDPRYLHATFLFDAPAGDRVSTLVPPVELGERVEIVGRVVYLYLPHGYGRTKVSNAYFERALGVGATTRNWNTVTALAAAGAEG